MKTRKRLKIYRDVIYILSALFIIASLSLATSISKDYASEHDVKYCVLSLTIGLLLFYKQYQINKKL